MKEITTTEVQRRLEAGEQLHLIDVRELAEVEEGHIPGVVHIPLGTLPDHLEELDQSKSYIIVCRSSARSGKATAFLQEKGFDATNMVGGMLAWEGEVE
ncbi:rhodanese-like domain-containing protein [Lysinibacillus odysseyi]|uniref:Rhodanese domain-containing protein n=1 Tax=Lysinibacillus odysseyi 34hs-1 = NBRC 100172 TaxID=1220589 RepID=A0A0A3IBB4_9BACI|nr:rhodanese-like domain-containing protein [Lysinibacillus odysseyi]KGR82019.1 hypothetical protein CD32_22255 [Lysinibacillus odysseyi 34hs-1 = NBRC 100172]